MLLKKFGIQLKRRDGKVFDPYPPPLKLKWDGKESRIGKWDMGHKKGVSYKSLKNKYVNCQITRKQLLDAYNDPKKYHPEDPSRNRSRVNDIN